jgi:hypothetical protein
MASQIEMEEVSVCLPEGLVEKIVAMMPFPVIFKARCLSKSWRSKFSSNSASEGAENPHAAASFQRQVADWSQKWNTFSPVLTTTTGFIAYDSVSQSWPSLPNFSFLPDISYSPYLRRKLAGPLFVAFCGQDSSTPKHKSSHHVMMGNILTQSWKKLPFRPKVLGTHVLCQELVIYSSMDMYRVIVISQKYGTADEYSFEIYHSKSDTWSSKDFTISRDISKDHRVAAYLNGVLYMMGVTTSRFSMHKPHSLLAFNVEEETLEEITLSFNNEEILHTSSLNLVIFREKTLMLATMRSFNQGGYDEMGRFNEEEYDDTVRMFNIDLESRQLVWLADGPPAALNFTIDFLPPVSDGDYLYYYNRPQASNRISGFPKFQEEGSRVVAYNVKENAWSEISVPGPRSAYQWGRCSFQPGLSPFLL